MPGPQFSATPPALQKFRDEGAGTIPSEKTAAAFIDAIQIFKWLPAHLQTHLTYSFIYGTGIQSAPGQPQNTVIQSLSGSFLLALGNHWAINYSPAWTIYSNNEFHNSITHSVSLSWHTAYEDWTFGFSQSYTPSSAPLVETGTQTDIQAFSTSLTASYRFNGRISLDMSVSQSLIIVEDFSSSSSWSTMEYLNFQLWPRLDIGIGVGGGYATQETGADSISENLQGRISWRATDKISLQVNGGASEHRFLGPDAADSVITPVFGASVQYQPVKTTSLSLSAQRSLTPSLLENQYSESTTVSVSLGQRLLKKLSLNLGASYSLLDHIASIQNVPAAQQDETYSVNAGLNFSVLKRATIGVSYQYSKSTSSQTEFAYSSSQFGVTVGYQF